MKVNLLMDFIMELEEKVIMMELIFMVILEMDKNMGK